jgi:TonB family protein
MSATQTAANLPGSSRALELHAHTRGHNVQVVWNPRARALDTADGGVLTIRDGAAVRTIPIAAEDLRAGTGATYEAASNQVSVRLDVLKHHAREASESVVVLLPPEVAAAPVLQPVENTADRAATIRVRQHVAMECLSGGGIPGHLYTRPRPLDMPRVEVPASAARELPAEVKVRVQVDSSGHAKDVKLASADGVNEALARAVVNSAEEWRFHPARIRKQPVPSEVLLAFRFEGRK